MLNVYRQLFIVQLEIVLIAPIVNFIPVCELVKIIARNLII